MDSRLGYDFSKVRIHTDETAARSAISVNALAYTLGSDIVFAEAQYQPYTLEGKRLLAHELVHVVQQTGGILKRPMPIAINSNNQQSLSRQSLGEIWSAITGVGAFDAYVASRLADDALAAARGKGLPGLHNGPADASRHAYWNCIMTKRLAAAEAKTIADSHEAHGGGPVIENAMDHHNNDAGRTCGTGPAACSSCTWSSLNSGALRVIDPVTGAIVPVLRQGLLLPRRQYPIGLTSQGDRMTQV
jgi:hypothetical protein